MTLLLVYTQDIPEGDIFRIFDEKGYACIKAENLEKLKDIPLAVIMDDQCREIHSCYSVFENLRQGIFRIKTFEQAESLTAMLSRTCPEPDRVALGLFELLANGIEHGNLDIGHEEKWTLMENGRYGEEITRRLALPAYRDRYVELTVEREKNLIIFRIEDQGAGFNHDDYLECDLSANEKCHGRGIALARISSFDCLEYIGKGNRVVAITKFPR